MLLRFPPKHLLSSAIALLLRSNPLQPLHFPFPYCSPSQTPNPDPLAAPPTPGASSIFRSHCRYFSTEGGSQMPQIKKRRLPNFHLDDSGADFGEIVRLVREDSDGLAVQLNQMDLRISPDFVLKILCVLNEEGIRALGFFNWVVNYSPGFVPSAKIYNQLVNNLGMVNDYDTMVSLLTELSHRAFCLTEKAFVFITRTSSDNLMNSVDRVIYVLNGARSCRGSGIFSLIRHLCSVNAFDLAIYVMEKTSRRTRYYNALIAAKCRNGDPQGARDMLDEMPQSNCDPDMNSFNYILSCLLRCNRDSEACGLLEIMEKSGFAPDQLTYELLVFHACKAGRIDLAIQFLDRMLMEGVRPRINTHAAFIKGYFLLGRVADACKYVQDMSVRDKFSVNVNYSLLSSLFCKTKRGAQAGQVLSEMMEKGFRPTWSVYMRVTKMLLKAGRGDMASQLKNMFLKFELQNSSP